MTSITIKPRRINITVDPHVDQVLRVNKQGPAGPPGPAGSAAYRELLTVTAIAQTVFLLANTPSQPHLSAFYVNGVKATYGTEYSINVAVLTWLSSLQLAPGDEVEINYA